MKIILFYDNFVRDYRGLLLLSALLRENGHKVWLNALWNNSIEFIKQKNPDLVVMGQIGEYTTSLIGDFIYKNNVILIINTSESVSYMDKLDIFFRFNFKEFNERYITLQVVPSRDLYDFVMRSNIREKNKYKFIGFPRMDLSVDQHFHAAEERYLREKYKIKNYRRVFLYVSSFIIDDAGGQVSEENKDDFDVESFAKKEKKLKQLHESILNRFLEKITGESCVLLIKKHPWDKSSYFEYTYAGSNCIILDNDEYIAPLISMADFLLHTESTSAIEAWIQRKKTISILPDFDSDRNKLRNHMRYEVIVKNYEELLEIIEHYPVPGPAEASLKIYEPFMDGKATIRLANEIDKLKPRSDKTEFEKDSFFSSCMGAVAKLTRCLKKERYDLSAVSKDDYMYNYLLWETKKEEVEKRYKKAIRNYIKENKDLIR